MKFGCQISRALRGIALSFALAVAGCAFVDESIDVRPTSNLPSSSIGQGQRVALTVVDERTSSLIGRRSVFDTAVIRAVQDVERTVDGSLQEGLRRQGFEPVPYSGDAPVTLRVQIRELSYDATQGFITLGQFARAALKVEASNNDDEYEQMYRAEETERSLVIPTESEDSAQINRALSSVIVQLLSDHQLLTFLATGAPNAAPASGTAVAR